ncbi:hypothetical protein COU56_02660 [Candidatus Pacearchaeota archaeon CG10_big_fil_rev_8_21_14_0_10_31_9]|nr:MAG: hypothetical protein AUJ62_03075 [Candidatus Pacearchaeota archaeon CG1_02_32_21]PIN94302.1 MAG: hypothetical protein COU56_02660 [Candidatus Pacearchaeota archaeon CG10_big_fil_rev_8_21_14_0_10_31_9]PIZ82739.1 MAG: hypothetical protein COX97_03230 [Candidatus Pacearchaeota archaeon CG_4_10_14_0_2_um_filter_05_32_18]
MSEIIGEILNNTIGQGITYFNNVIPEDYKVYYTFAVFTLLITLYALFIWNFYRLLSKRDILDLNLAKYNKYDDAIVKKILAFCLFVLEYIVILPILVFFWFFVMAFIMLLLAKDLPINQITLISACIVGAIRITSYYNEDLSREFAKLFPFTILAVAFITPGFFDIPLLVSKLSGIDSLFIDVIFYLIVIMALEVILRVFEIIMPDKEEK